MSTLEKLKIAMNAAYNQAETALQDVAYENGEIAYDATYEAASEAAYASLIAYEAQLNRKIEQ